MTNEEREKLRLELLEIAKQTHAKIAKWEDEHPGECYSDCQHQGRLIGYLKVRGLMPGMKHFCFRTLCLHCGYCNDDLYSKFTTVPHELFLECLYAICTGRDVPVQEKDLERIIHYHEHKVKTICRAIGILRYRFKEGKQ